MAQTIPKITLITVLRVSTLRANQLSRLDCRAVIGRALEPRRDSPDSFKEYRFPTGILNDRSRKAFFDCDVDVRASTCVCIILHLEIYKPGIWKRLGVQLKNRWLIEEGRMFCVLIIMYP